MLKDMMPHFDLYQPDTLDAARGSCRRGWVRTAGWSVAGRTATTG